MLKATIFSRRPRYAYAARRKSYPQEMLPVVDKPLIQYIVQECYASGIREVYW